MAHQNPDVCLCDLDEVKFNHVFRSHLATLPIFDKLEIVDDVQEGEKLGVSLISYNILYNEDCWIVRNIVLILSMLVRTLEERIGENNFATIGKIHLEEEVDNEKHVFHFRLWYALSN